MKRPQATTTERPFQFDELFFSTTNERGVIQFGNDVFVEISGYHKEILIGAPHSIIRHPDMPKAVFKLLWSTIQSGQPIAAYVKNLAADGSYYWVLAFVFPIEEGYLSIRIKPSSELFDAAKNLYAEALKVEETGDLEVSVPFLIEQIQKAGFTDYQDFMIKAAFAELTNLQEHKSKSTAEVGMSVQAANISDVSHEASDKLKDAFQRIRSFQESSHSFVKTMNHLGEAFQHLKYIALNMTISAAKFKENGASLGVVAKEFSKLSEQIQDHLSALLEFVGVLTTGIRKSSLAIVALDTQMLMVEFFIRGSIKKMNTVENAFSDMIQNRNNFLTLFKSYSADLLNETQSMRTHLNSLSGQMLEVRKFTTGLEVIRQMGAVESSRENEIRQTFVHYLDEMRNFITLLQNSTSSIHKEMNGMQASCEVIIQQAEVLAGRVDQIFDLAESVAQPKD